MHPGSLFRIVINPGIVGGGSNDLPGVGTTARQSGGTEETITNDPRAFEPPIDQPRAGSVLTPRDSCFACKGGARAAQSAAAAGAMPTGGNQQLRMPMKKLIL